MSIEHADPLVAPIRRVLDMRSRPAPPGVLPGPLDVALERFTLVTVVEVTPDVFVVMATACRQPMFQRPWLVSLQSRLELVSRVVAEQRPRGRGSSP